MAYRIFGRLPLRGRLLAGCVMLGGAAVGVTGNELRWRPSRKNGPPYSPAEEQFHTSSLHPVPQGWEGRVWSIRNDYPDILEAKSKVAGGGSDGGMPVLPGPEIPLPSGDPISDAPWLGPGTDFRRFPETYGALIKEYCLEGNVENDFVVQNNEIRQWYHAPWMHWSKKGREPLNGFTSELATPPGVIAATQKRYIQNWACGFYNTAGASIFGKMWRDPSNPDWSGDIKFPLGTCVFKILLTDATEEEIMTLRGAPTMKAVIAPPGPSPNKAPDPRKRNDFPTDLRLLQVDFAVRDDRAPIGWVFGTLIYDGRRLDKNPWNRLIPVGLMWGNSPELTQEAFEKGNKPTEQWLNPDAQKLMEMLGGTKPSPGWNGRLNGPVDNFVSACASCHSLSQKTGQPSLVFRPPPVQLPDGRWVPKDDASTMQWFRNIPAGKPCTEGATAGDYSLQLMMGWHNYQDWKNSKKDPVSRWWIGRKFAWSGETMPGAVEKREGRGQQYHPAETLSLEMGNKIAASEFLP